MTAKVTFNILSYEPTCSKCALVCSVQTLLLMIYSFPAPFKHGSSGLEVSVVTRKSIGVPVQVELQYTLPEPNGLNANALPTIAKTANADRIIFIKKGAFFNQKAKLWF